MMYNWYRVILVIFKNMELWGVEPQASWMQIKRSTNWATTPTDIHKPYNINNTLTSLAPLQLNSFSLLSLGFSINLNFLIPIPTLCSLPTPASLYFSRFGSTRLLLLEILWSRNIFCLSLPAWMDCDDFVLSKVFYIFIMGNLSNLPFCSSFLGSERLTFDI